MNPARDIRSISQEAITLHQQGEIDRAAAIYREILEMDPAEPNAWHLLGVAAWQRGDLVNAEAHIRKAIGLLGTAPAYHSNLGGVLKQKGEFAQAIDSYLRALSLKPDDRDAKRGLAESYGRYAHALSAAYEWDKAEAVYRKLLELNPADSGALNNLAQILHNAGEADAAMPLYDQAIGLRPESALARYNRGICQLGENRLVEGWADISASRQDWLPLMDAPRDAPWRDFPLWDGGDLRGKRILVWGNQGVGDEILYASMIPDLLTRGAIVTIECDPRLVPLLTRSFSAVTVLSRETRSLPGRNFDCHAPGLWLARWLRPDFNAFPTHNIYLKADTRMVEVLRARYANKGKTRIIGLAWDTKTMGHGEQRRIDLPELISTLPHQDILYIDLQYGDTAAVREATQKQFPDFTLYHDPAIDQLLDLDTFAAQVAACDAVVTIGNTTAHIAGASGVSGAVLLPHAGRTWYWFRDQARSSWYPSLALLRKSPASTWKSALGAAALVATIKGSS